MKPPRLLSRLALLATSCALLLAAGSASAQNKTVRLAWIASVNSPHVAVAIDKQLWKSRGLDVSVINFATGREGLEALLGGQVDLVSMAEFPVSTAAARNQKLAVIADLSRNKVGRIVTTTEFPTIKSLDGRKLGTTVGTNTHYQLEAALESAGIKGTIVNAAPSDLLPSLMRKDIDAATMFPAAIPRARVALGAAYKELPTPDYVAHSLITTSEQALAEKGAEMRVFLQGLIAAEAVVLQTPALAQQSVIATSRGGVTQSDLTDSWADYDFKIVLADDLLVLLTQQARWLSTKGMVKGAATTSEQMRTYIKPGPLQALDPQRVTLK